MKINVEFNIEDCPEFKDLLENIFESLKNAQLLYNEGSFQKAYDLIIPVTKQFDKFVTFNFHGPSLDVKEYRYVYELAGQICGELEKFDEALDFYKKHQFFRLQLKHDFQNEETVTLYQFRNTRRYALNNIVNNEITLVDPRIQNDIVDSPIYAWLETLCGKNARHKKHLKALIKSYHYLRATSFCSDYNGHKAVQNPLMWAHYANCHKGVCVEYELGKKDFMTNQTQQAACIRLMKINYIDAYNPNESLDFTKKDTKLNARLAFATKSKEWEYENEVRMIGYTPTEESKYVQIALETPNPIKAIYFGVRCSTQRKNKIKNLLIERPEIKFYQMKINPQNIHVLSFEPY